MIRRMVTAVPLAVLAGWLIIQKREWLFILVLLAVVEIALREFFAIGRNAGLRSLTWLGYGGAMALCLAQAAEIHHTAHTVAITLGLLAFVIFVAALISWPDPKGYLAGVATTLLGIVYVAFALSLLIPLRFSDPATGRMLTLLLFLATWGNDIFAYAVGRWIGRTFLYPRISPRKTFEGSIAGLTGAVLVGWLFGRYYWKAVSLALVVILSLVIAVSSQAGDVVESAMKREANMKDSSTLLPGHGGMLDRIDSLLFATPVLWLVWELRGVWRP
jgi:phosphatidate cytidylyltransferase